MWRRGVDVGVEVALMRLVNAALRASTPVSRIASTAVWLVKDLNAAGDALTARAAAVRDEYVMSWRGAGVEGVEV